MTLGIAPARARLQSCPARRRATYDPARLHRHALRHQARRRRRADRLQPRLRRAAPARARGRRLRCVPCRPGAACRRHPLRHVPGAARRRPGRGRPDARQPERLVRTRRAPCAARARRAAGARAAADPAVRPLRRPQAWLSLEGRCTRPAAREGGPRISDAHGARHPGGLVGAQLEPGLPAAAGAARARLARAAAGREQRDQRHPATLGQPPRGGAPEGPAGRHPGARRRDPEPSAVARGQAQRRRCAAQARAFRVRARAVRDGACGRPAAQGLPPEEGGLPRAARPLRGRARVGAPADAGPPA